MSSIANEFLKRLGYMWYIMDPRDHLYAKVEDVPDYYKEITPAYIFLIVLEQIILLLQGKNILRLNDTVTNLSQGILMELSKIPMHGVELVVYTWLYNNWRICTLPWDSVWTWVFCMIVSDLCFYWAHRSVHHISILWLFHEPHHSSEDFNMTTPLRLSIFHNFSLWLTYLPLALAVPPSVYLVHFQLSIIFQFWLHTQVVRSVGILEHVFVTPSHHRVHHGRNRRCIDKNFGSIFILWDKLFGTFEPEGIETIAFGITKPLQTFSPVAVQFNYLRIIWHRLKTVNGFFNKISCIVKGPGWSPGKPWMGCLQDIPEPTENEPKYDPKLPKWLKLYILLHTSALVVGYFQMMFNLSTGAFHINVTSRFIGIRLFSLIFEISTFVFSICGSYMVLTTIGLGYLLDFNVLGPAIEIIRCLLFFFVDAIIQNEFKNEYVLLNLSMYCFRHLFLFSSMLWVFASPFVIYVTWEKRN